MAVSLQDIQAWMAANAGASDATIASTMQQHGVTPEMMAQATGANLSDVTSRYNAAIAPTQPTNTQPSVNYTLSSLPENGLNPAFGLDGMNVKKFMDATGADFQTATDLLYGNIGSNKDYRNWQAIMSSADPLKAAQEATNQMYGGYDVRYLYNPETKDYQTQLYSKSGVNLTSLGGGKTLAEAQDPTRWSGYQRFGLTAPPTDTGTVYNYDPKTYTPYSAVTNPQPWMNMTNSNPNFQSQQPQQQYQYQPIYQQPQAQQPSYGYTPPAPQQQGYQFQPVYSNPLMRPVTANSNIAPQQAPSNMGYQNRTSLWGDV